ncbi:DNA oxidative demethylase ALKBH2-like [Pantherophis guttatus]|uniref:DNA oxidative demethylase ALKBH2-like n=1 Tax=Pantherophis guttatus TaxID=94885 RepID=A0ABM3YNH7_PANGU|nr:DNA oxidative demethylase ALKBH2-like [Pantherophis guttatus]
MVEPLSGATGRCRSGAAAAAAESLGISREKIGRNPPASKISGGGLAHAPWALHPARERAFGWPVVLRVARGGKEAPLSAVLTCPLPPLKEEAGAAAAGWRFPLCCRAQADEIFQQLEKEVEYFEGEFTKLHIFGKWHEIPRKQVTYGDAGFTYTYSGVTFSPKPWIPILNRIRDRVQLVTTHTFNFILINRYKDGHDHIGEHRDDERELVPHSPIASVSFGACRDFIFRHGASRGKIASRRIAPVKLQLDHGSLLMMNFPTNHYWYHSLPSRKKVLAPRINLTFRKVRTL